MSDQIWALDTCVQKLPKDLRVTPPSFWIPCLTAPSSVVRSSKTGPWQGLWYSMLSHYLDGFSLPPNTPLIPMMLHFPMSKLSSGYQQNSPNFSLKTLIFETALKLLPFAWPQRDLPSKISWVPCWLRALPPGPCQPRSLLFGLEHILLLLLVWLLVSWTV